MLTPLPFGNDSQSLHLGLAASAQAMAQVVPTLRVYEAKRGEIFRSKSAYCQIGDMKIVTNSSDACLIEVDESEGWHLLVPHTGLPVLQTDGKKYAIQPINHYMLLPNSKRRTEKPFGSMTIVSLNSEKLNHVIACMKTGFKSTLSFEQHPEVIDISKRSDIIISFRKILSFIDIGKINKNILEAFSIDNLIYRWICLGIYPENREYILSESEFRSSHKIDIVCDAILAAHERPLTLTEMEELGGMSARNLQYAFKSRFNCSPMEWQRRERMHKARQRVLLSEPGETLTDICFALGFSSLAAFSATYKRYFHETPSETLQKR